MVAKLFWVVVRVSWVIDKVISVFFLGSCYGLLGVLLQGLGDC